MDKRKTKDPVKFLAKINRESLIKRFYLAGGSALNIHLKHRLSFDLDFFSRKKFNAMRLISELKPNHEIKVLAMEEGTLRLLLDNVPVSFFEYPYLLLESKIYQGIQIASVLDIALMKVIAILQRGERKDFIDLYYILTRGGMSMEEILDAMDKKFKGVRIEKGSIFKSLSYFQEAEKSGPVMPEKGDWPKAKKFFRAEVARLISDSGLK